MLMPIMGITTQCQGWLATLDSFGRTSQPQVSAQIAAMSVRRIQSAVSNRRPGRTLARVALPGACVQAVPCARCER